jgi:hypothetical protein
MFQFAFIYPVEQASDSTRIATTVKRISEFLTAIPVPSGGTGKKPMNSLCEFQANNPMREIFTHYE